MTPRTLLTLLFFLLLSGMALLAGPAHAATITVSNTGDTGAGSLRQAILDSNASTGVPDTIAFNIPSGDPNFASGVFTITPASALPVVTDPVTIDGYTQPGASPNTLAIGNNAVLKIVLRGGDLVIRGGNSIIQGLVINGFRVNNTGGGTGIRLDTNGGNLIRGNYIGTNAEGTAALGHLYGIQIEGSNNNVIGGTAPGDRNLISGSFTGIYMSGSATVSGTTIQGNYIGTNAAGTAAIGGSSRGVICWGQAQNTLIGGAVAGARNVISGNLVGIDIGTSGGSLIQGNYIGTDATGTAAIPNLEGIGILNSQNVTIGGTSPGAGNVISGNTADGIYLSSPAASGFIIQGNYIGTDMTGTAPLGNGEDGIEYRAGSSNTIGGLGAGNTIAFNAGMGINIFNGTGTLIQNNSIFSNGGVGIGVTFATGTNLRANSIFSNGGLGIDLLSGFPQPNSPGVTPNDPGDADTGSNNLQNYPILTFTDTSSGSTTVQGTLNSTANAAFTLEFFSNATRDPSGFGEGQTPLGSTAVTTDSSGNASFNVTLPVAASGPFITATATDSNGNTSEFSGSVRVPINVVNTNDSGPGSLRQAILDANANPGPALIRFNIPGGGVQTITPVSPLPAITSSVVIDGYTQPGASPNTLAIGNNAVLLIELNGSSTPAGTNGLTISAGNSTVRGLIINRFSPSGPGGNGIELNTNGNNVISGNFIGTNATGTAALSNGDGIEILTSNNLIGGTTASERNVISGNSSGSTSTGILISGAGATNNTIQGNYIGTNATGAAAIGNRGGVSVHTDAVGNLIGGTTVLTRNVISGNASAGIILSGSSTNGNNVQGNYIGTNATGTAAIPNFEGIDINSKNNTIGGTVAGAGNLISGNTTDGIHLISFSNSGNHIQGNRIGTDSAGTGPIGNGGSGVFFGGVTGNTVGGSTTSAGNIIAFNNGFGVNIESGINNLIQNNSIFSNGADGIRIYVGGSNSIRGNVIYSNIGLAIDLEVTSSGPLGDGVSPNDAGDADTGSNSLQNFPVITSATTPASGPTVVSGTLNSTANSTFAIDLFQNDSADTSGFGEGQTFVNSQNVTTDASGNANFSFTVNGNLIGKFFTATATNTTTGDTSEFSQAVVVPQALSLSITPNTFSEGAGANAATGTVSRNTPTTSDLTINLLSSNTGKATVPASVIIPAGSVSATFPIAAVDNALVDGPQAVTITASQTGFTSGTSTVTVTDNDVPTLAVSVTPNTFSENAGANAATGTVTRNTATTAALTVNLSSLSVGATPKASVPATVTIPAGSASVTFAVAAVDNTIVDGSQQVTIQASQTDFTSGSTTVTVTDNDVPTLTVSVTPTTFSEGAGATAATGTVTRNTSTTASLLVKIESNNTNKVTAPTNVTIPAGAASVNFSLGAVDNTLVDGPQTVTITASTTGFTSATTTVTVTDNDIARLSLSITPTSFSEAAGAVAATGTVTRNTATTAALTVNLSSSLTSRAGAPATVTIPAGQASATFSIAAVDNTVAEGSQTVTITASQTGFTSGIATVTVTDNDVATLTLSVTPNTFSEGAGAFAATGTVTRNTPTTAALTVNLTSSNTSKARVPASVNIPAGGTSVNFSIAAVENTVADGPQQVVITARLTNFTSGTATVTVTDNDTPTLTLTITPTSFSEAGGANAATATLTRNTLTTAALTVNLSSSDRTAATVPASVTIPIGSTSTTFRIAAVDDTVADGTQTATITASATGFAPVSRAVNVTDNESASLVVRVSPATFSEAGGTNASTGSVTRNTRTGASLVVTLSSSDTGEARVPASVIIPAGAASATFPIAGVDDAVSDGSQTVTLTARATGLTSGTATVTVTDNDASSLTVTVTPPTFSEAAGAFAATGTVTRNSATGSSLVVTLTSSNTGEVTVPATVTIPAGATSVNFSIAAKDDSAPDGNKTVTITVSRTGFTSGTARVTVTDNDNIALTLSGIPGQVGEDAGRVNATLTRNGPLTAALTVRLTSSNPSAVTVAASVIIPAGQSSVTFPVQVVDDTLLNGPKTATITASAGGLRSATANITVLENDVAQLRLSVNPNTFREDVGELAAIGAVTRNTATTTALVVTLRSSAPGQVRVPATVTIPAGATAANFVLDALDDTVVNGNHKVDITATAGTLTTLVTLTLTDNDRAALSLSVRPANFSEGAGAAAATGIVRRNTPTTSALVVNLVSDKPGKATVPASVTIPAGAASATFAVSAVDNSIADGPQRVTIRATAVDFLAADAAVTVQDNELASQFSISGRVMTTITNDAGQALKVPVPGVTLQLFTGSILRDVITNDPSGAYRFRNLPAGTYRITPVKQHYIFVPPSRTVTITNGSIPAIDFDSIVRGRISGRVGTRRADGGFTPRVGVGVTARSGTRTVTATTDRNGFFLLNGLGLGSHTVLPEVPGTFFQPKSRVIILPAIKPEITDVNFETAGTDTTAPAVTVASPRSGDFTPAAQPLRVVGTASDGGSGVVVVTVAIARFSSATGSTPSGFYNWNTRAFATADDALQVEKLATGTTSWSLANLPVLPVGFYGLRATARDAAGNVKRSDFVRLNIAEATTSGSLGAISNPSTVALSSGVARAATSSIELRFSGLLDAESAGDPTHYTVQVNGVVLQVESAAYNATTRTVTLGLSAGVFKAGDDLRISWHGLQDAQDRTLVNSHLLAVAR